MSKAPFSVVFAGTPDFAVAPLLALIEDSAFDVKLVITQPDRPVGRKKTLTPPPVKQVALDAGIEVAQPENINNFQFSIFNFQFLVVFAYGQILSQQILDLPSIAPINLHPSLLPRWRGPSPMKSAILAGDTETGVTIQRMVKALDAGPILAQEATPIGETETSTELQKRLIDMGSKLLVDTLKKPLTETEQDESQVTMCKMLDRSSGEIRLNNLEAIEIDRNVRALNPWPGVRTEIDGQEVKLITVSRLKQPDSIDVPCKDGEIHIVTLQPPGKQPMSGQAWLRGRN